MNAPADVRQVMFWERIEHDNGTNEARGYLNPDANWPACSIYWGSHGCCRPKGHDGDHWCDCCECDNHPDDDSGCVAGPPYYGPNTNFWGDYLRSSPPTTLGDE